MFFQMYQDRVIVVVLLPWLQVKFHFVLHLLDINDQYMFKHKKCNNDADNLLHFNKKSCLFNIRMTWIR